MLVHSATHTTQHRCGHCQTLKPIIEETAALLAPHGVTMATVDIEDPRAQKLHKKYQVTNIPAIKLFRKGQVFEYEGPVEMPLKAQGQSVSVLCHSGTSL